jgi:hypothetical protein
MLLLLIITLISCSVSWVIRRHYYVINWYPILISCDRSFFLGSLIQICLNLNFACLPLTMNWKNLASLGSPRISSDWWWKLRMLSHLYADLQSGKCYERIRRSFEYGLDHLGINLCHLTIYDDFYFSWTIKSYLTGIYSNKFFLTKKFGTIFLIMKVFLSGHDSISNISVPFFEES